MNRRKNHLIEKDFQVKFIIRFSLIVLISSIIIGALLLFLARHSTTVTIENTKVMVKSSMDFLLPLIIITFIIGLIISAISVSLLCLYTSHKIAGPLYRFKKEIEKISEGNLNVDFRIRGGDQFKDLAQSLEKMVTFFKKRS